jgi:hypothetical protein
MQEYKTVPQLRGDLSLFVVFLVTLHAQLISMYSKWRTFENIVVTCYFLFYFSPFMVQLFREVTRLTAEFLRSSHWAVSRSCHTLLRDRFDILVPTHQVPTCFLSIIFSQRKFIISFSCKIEIMLSRYGQK